MGDRFDIHEDIRRASTLPARVYTDPEIYAAQQARVFARSWQYVADLDAVRIPGQVYPFTLLEGCLDEPLLLTRTADDRLHCLSNVCTHRGNLVCEHPGHERTLRCRYHGRRFALDGHFQDMPEFEGVVDFPGPRDNLTSVPLGLYEQLLFVALEPACSFDEWIAPLRSRLGWLPLPEFTAEPTRCKDYLVRANWALYCENYLEGFHIPFVHSALAETLDFGSYRTELFPLGSVQIGIAKGGEHTFALPSSSPDYGQDIAAYYFWLYPNTMFNFYPWGLSINVVKPLSVDLTRVSFLAYVWDTAKLEKGAGASLDRVEREDETIVEAVQKGVRSRFYDQGRYSPTREQGTHHFHRLLAAALAK